MIVEYRRSNAACECSTDVIFVLRQEQIYAERLEVGCKRCAAGQRNPTDIETVMLN